MALYTTLAKAMHRLCNIWFETGPNGPVTKLVVGVRDKPRPLAETHASALLEAWINIRVWRDADLNQHVQWREGASTTVGQRRHQPAGHAIPPAAATAWARGLRREVRHDALIMEAGNPDPLEDLLNRDFGIQEALRVVCDPAVKKIRPCFGMAASTAGS
ncbi:hypothetical protein VTI74DRAFT_2447 [Chaetomium olivicolor]